MEWHGDKNILFSISVIVNHVLTIVLKLTESHQLEAVTASTALPPLLESGFAFVDETMILQEVLTMLTSNIPWFFVHAQHTGYLKDGTKLKVLTPSLPLVSVS